VPAPARPNHAIVLVLHRSQSDLAWSPRSGLGLTCPEQPAGGMARVLGVVCLDSGPQLGFALVKIEKVMPGPGILFPPGAVWNALTRMGY
jgi:hypothetical protein